MEIVSSFGAHFSLKEFNYLSNFKQIEEANSQVLELLECIEPVRDEESLHNLITSLLTEVEICEQNGSALLVEEGLEHYIAYELETIIPKRLAHAEYLSIALNYLQKDIYCKELGIEKSYRDYGLSRDMMNEVVKRASQKLKRDVEKVYGK
jgi:hypothetical protein